MVCLTPAFHSGFCFDLSQLAEKLPTEYAYDFSGLFCLLG